MKKWNISSILIKNLKKFMLGRKKGLLGVDIGSSSVKISLLEGTKEGAKVKDLWISPLPPEAIAEGDIMERDAVVETLKRYIDEKKPSTKNVASFIPNPRALNIKRIKMDKLPPEEVKEQIKWQAEQYFGLDPTEISVDGDIVDPDVSETEIEVMLVAARNDAVLDYVSVLKSSGLAPKVLDVHVFALYNVFEFNYPDIAKSEDINGVLHIGKNFSTVFYFAGKGPYLIRDIRISIRDLINMMQERLDLSYEDSEAIIKGEKEASSAMTFEIYREYTSRVADEVKKTFPYIEKKETPDRIYVSGGGSLVPEFIQNLAEELGVQTERMNPFERISLSDEFYELGTPEILGALFAPSLGLSLRGVL